MPPEPHVVASDDLATAWLTATEWTANNPTRGQALVVTVGADSDGRLRRDPTFERKLSDIIDSIKDANGKKEVVPFIDNASMIFPQNMWNARKSEGRPRFYERYQALLPRIKKLSRKNVYGVYFERMIAFANVGAKKPVNQVEHVIHLLSRSKRLPRRSALQIAVFHPAFDHTGQAQRGFPCLQQVSFAYSEEERTLHLNAYYPTQYLFERGYGNYLGLGDLGNFVASQTGFAFSGLTCFVGSPCNDHGKGEVLKHCRAFRAEMHLDPVTVGRGTERADAR